MKLSDFNELVFQFAQAETTEDITRLCVTHCAKMGFDNFIYALRVPTSFAEARIITIKGYPDSWLTHYFENAYYLDDPVIMHCKKHLIPIQWQDLGPVSTEMGERIMNEATEFGLKGGISMPVHGPTGEFGIFSMTLNEQKKMHLELIQQASPYIHLFAAYLHETVQRVLSLDIPDKKLLLTAREKECLRWTADGKTSWEISQLLNTSERTINFHLTNSMSKLDVNNRQHAVAKAVLQGIINPNPF